MLLGAPNNTLFIVNFDIHQLTKRQLSDFFLQYGEIDNVTLVSTLALKHLSICFAFSSLF